MAKLIVNPSECGHQSRSTRIKKGSAFVPVCTYPADDIMRVNSTAFYKPCTNSRNFPTDCPLQNGRPVNKSIEELIELAKTELNKKGITCSNDPKKRRNRKNCIHYVIIPSLPNNEAGRFCNSHSYKGNHSDCRGVDCGDFKHI